MNTHFIGDACYFLHITVGVIAKIRQEVKLKDRVIRVMISTKERAKLMALSQSKPYLVGDAVTLGDDVSELSRVEVAAMMRNLRELYDEYLAENPRASRSARDKIYETESLSTLIDVIAMQISFTFSKRQEILNCLNLTGRYELLNEYLTGKSYAEIAQKLNCQEKSVDTALTRIRRKGSDLMQDYKVQQ